MLYYSTNRVGHKYEKHWRNWLDQLKPGNKALVQRFCTHGDTAFGVRLECWAFDPVIISKDNKAEYISSGRDFALRDGLVLCDNYETVSNYVFDSRIVPWDNDLVDPILHDVKHMWPHSFSTVYCHAPAYEPEWVNAERCYVLCASGSDMCKLTDKFPHSYVRNVCGDDVLGRRTTVGGLLVTVFALSDQVEEYVSRELPKSRFCWAESVWS